MQDKPWTVFMQNKPNMLVTDQQSMQEYHEKIFGNTIFCRSTKSLGNQGL
jgi:hypothetical protein